MKWPEKLQLFTYMQATPIVKKAVIQNQIKLDDKNKQWRGKYDKVLKPKPVKLGIIDL